MKKNSSNVKKIRSGGETGFGGKSNGGSYLLKVLKKSHERHADEDQRDRTTQKLKNSLSSGVKGGK